MKQRSSKGLVLVLLGIVLLIVIAPLFLRPGAAFGGSDDAGSEMVAEVTGEAYEPWFTPVLETALGGELPGEIESLLFWSTYSLRAGTLGGAEEVDGSDEGGRGGAIKERYEFDAVIHGDPESGGAYVVFPYDIREVFGAGRVKVRAAFDGIGYEGSIVNMGLRDEQGQIRYVLCLLKAIRAALGKGPGDTVHVVVVRR